MPLGVTYRLGGGWMIGAQGLYMYTGAREDVGTDAQSHFGVSLAVSMRMGKEGDDGDNKKDSKKDKKKEYDE